GQTLISAGLVKGRTMTGFKSVRPDLANAGANVKDEEVVVDGNLISSRNPDDIPAFNKKFIEVLSKTGVGVS
ncbi:MAG: DJ-1/PfpI family protein, partial [Lewinella sp.]